MKWLVKTTNIFRLGSDRILDIPLTTEEQSSVKILYASLVTQQNVMPSHRNLFTRRVNITKLLAV